MYPGAMTLFVIKKKQGFLCNYPPKLDGPAEPTWRKANTLPSPAPSCKPRRLRRHLSAAATRPREELIRKTGDKDQQDYWKAEHVTSSYDQFFSCFHCAFPPRARWNQSCIFCKLSKVKRQLAGTKIARQGFLYFLTPSFYPFVHISPPFSI